MGTDAPSPDSSKNLEYLREGRGQPLCLRRQLSLTNIFLKGQGPGPHLNCLGMERPLPQGHTVPVQHVCSLVLSAPAHALLSAMLSKRTKTWCPIRSSRKVLRARKTASISSQLIYNPFSVLYQEPEVGLPLHRAPQPVLNPYVETTFLVETNPMFTPVW